MGTFVSGAAAGSKVKESVAVGMTDWFIYLIRCHDNSLYTGISTDVARRFGEHQQDKVKGSRYLRGKGPLQLVFQAAAGDRSQASRLENRIKRLSRASKLRLIAGELELNHILEQNKR
jgi:putative endonuclease